METTTVKPHLWTDGGSKVLLLKRIDKDGTTRDGKFPYPQVGGIVTAPDFNSTPRCGNGIHWWPWGIGLGEGMDYDIIDDIWLVGAELPDKIIGELDDGEKCKTQCAEIVYRGSFAGAWAMVNSGRHRLIEAMAKAASGNYSSSAASGDSSSSAASGNYSSAMANGFYSRARCGLNGCFAILWWDESSKRPRIAVGEAGIDGVKPDTWYEVKNGKLVEYRFSE